MAVVALVLGALAPLGYQPVLTTRFVGDDIGSRQRLLALLADESVGNAATRRVAEAVPPIMRKRIIAAHKGRDQPPSRDDLADTLNDLCDRQADWYDATTWEGFSKLREQRALDEALPNTLSIDQQKRLARLRLEPALAGAVRARPNRSVQITYAGFAFPRDVPTSPDDFHRLLNVLVLPLIINILLGVGGILVAILVTSSVVPQLFNGGSLQLLLSKPVRRAPLLLSIVGGATSFIVVCVTPLVLGLVLIAWLRFDLWNPRLLLCIPLFILLFLVYYSVSATAGLIWRNAIVSVAVTAIFWFACVFIQGAASIADSLVEQPERIERLAANDSRLLAATASSRLTEWNALTGQWAVLLDASIFEPKWLIGPELLPDGDVIAAQGRWPIGGAGRMLLLESNTVAVEPTWPLPPGCTSLDAVGDGSVISGTTAGPFRLSAELSRKRYKEEDEAEPIKRALKAVTNYIGWTNRSEAFEALLPRDSTLQMPISQVVTPDGAVIVCGRGELLRLGLEIGKSKVVAKQSLDGAAEKPVRLGVASNRLLASRNEEPFRWFDAVSLEPIDIKAIVPMLPEIKQIASPKQGDQIALLTIDGTVLIANAKTLTITHLRSARNAQAIYWRSEHVLLVAYNTDSVVMIDVNLDRIQETIQPALGGWRKLNRYLVEPLAAIFPQPGKLGATIRATILGDDQFTFGENEFESQTIELSPWKPLVNCIIFTGLMLGLACLYFQRLDL